jgi:hypothetical protein
MSQRVLPDVLLHNRSIKLLPLLVLLMVALPACHRNIVGDWVGTFDEDFSQRLVLHVTIGPGGGLVVSQDNLDLGTRNMRADSVTLFGNRLNFIFFWPWEWTRRL